MLSVFTPTHDTRYLNEAYSSLLDQTDKDWQWTILYNGGARPLGFPDNRVLEISTNTKPFVGALKAEVCDIAPGDILLELDHDDLLVPAAVEECKKAFQDDVGFAFSNSLIVNMDWSARPRYNSGNGWEYRETKYGDHTLDEPVTFDPSPASVSRIWYAPDHFRAFRKEYYRKVGGHRSDMRVLDDLDLMCRMYQETTFKHIDKGLYVYRVHGDNAWLKHNQEIQNNVYRIYDQYIQPMAMAWAKREGLRCIDLGGRMFSTKGFESVDRKDADICCDLEQEWPFRDSSVGVVRAMDVIEHLRDPLHTMKELYRVLAPGGYAFIQVPSTDGRGAFADPTHVSFWNEGSFAYYTEQRKAKYIDTPVRFQASRLYTTDKNEDGICWTIAHLISLKDGYRPPGAVLV